MDDSATDILFSVVGVLGKRIETTKAYWDRIVEWKHPSMKGRESEVRRTLIDADEVRQSRSDPHVSLYYRRHRRGWLCVVVKHLNGSGFIVTAYLTDRIKEGVQSWTK